jgi:hypothetical protein
MDIVRLESPQGHIKFEDSLEHFEHGVLRLLGLGRDAFEHWLAVAETEPRQDLLERLGSAFRRLSPMARASTMSSGQVDLGPGGVPGSLWHTSIADHRHFGVARSEDGSLGWLVQFDQDHWRRVLEPPPPEELRIAQLRALKEEEKWCKSDWRREKSQRLARELVDVASVSAGRVLEVGMTSDSFRCALDDLGLEHEGVGVSMAGNARSVLERREPGYAAVTFWDYLAREPDPEEVLHAATRCLVSGGVVAVKTPNLRCPEARMFGPHFPAFRREHLVYLTPESLVSMCQRAGLGLVRLTTPSHLLVGFIGADACAELAAEKRGSDLIAYFRRTG